MDTARDLRVKRDLRQHQEHLANQGIRAHPNHRGWAVSKKIQNAQEIAKMKQRMRAEHQIKSRAQRLAGTGAGEAVADGEQDAVNYFSREGATKAFKKYGYDYMIKALQDYGMIAGATAAMNYLGPQLLQAGVLGAATAATYGIGGAGAVTQLGLGTGTAYMFGEDAMNNAADAAGFIEESLPDNPISQDHMSGIPGF